MTSLPMMFVSHTRFREHFTDNIIVKCICVRVNVLHKFLFPIDVQNTNMYRCVHDRSRLLCLDKCLLVNIFIGICMCERLMCPFIYNIVIKSKCSV